MGRLLVHVWHRRGTAVLAVAVVALDLLLFSTLLNAGTSSGAPAAFVMGYAVAGGAILFWQRRAPLPGYVALWLHALGSVALTGYRPTLLLLVGLYTVTVQLAGRTAVMALLASVAPIGLAVSDGVREAPPNERLSTLVGIGTLLIAVHCGAFGIGRWAWSVRARARTLERGREYAARDAVEVERQRIAYELHDILAHSVTLMTLQAAGAKKVMRHDPSRAEAALSQVGGAGAQAMSELRHMLGGLRPSRSASLARLDELLAAVRAAGVDVTLRCEGTPVVLKPAIDVAAYRIVQEALTNVAKHVGPGARATVALCWQAGQVRIEVIDDGRGDPTDAGARLSTGNGLAGLAERVAELGGRVESGRASGRGFRVLATLPIGAADPIGTSEPMSTPTVIGLPVPAVLRVWSDDAAAHPAG